MTRSESDSKQWKISFTATAEKQFQKLEPSIRRDINRYIYDRLLEVDNPRYYGKPLEGLPKEFWRFRVRDYRLICELHDRVLTIVVVKIAHRREVYKKLHLLRPSS